MAVLSLSTFLGHPLRGTVTIARPTYTAYLPCRVRPSSHPRVTLENRGGEINFALSLFRAGVALG